MSDVEVKRGLAESVYDAVMKDLMGRSAIENVFDDIDDDVRAEVQATCITKIQRVLASQANEAPAPTVAMADRAGLEADVRFLNDLVRDYVPGTPLERYDDTPELQAYAALGRIAAALGLKEQT